MAGAAGCSISHALATPLDVVKTRQQSDRSRYVHSRTGQPLSVFDTVRQIARNEGAGALLQGLGATCIGYLVQGAFKFSLWEAFKVVLGFPRSTGCMKVLILVAAAFIAEIFASLLLCPFERARIKMVSDPGFASNPVPEIRQKMREEGVLRTLYGEGLMATLFKQTTYTIAKLTTYAVLSDELRIILPREVPRPVITLISSVMAGFVAAIASQPGDTLQICTSSNSTLREDCPVDVETGEQPGLLKLAKAIGWKGLFTGWRARLLHVEVIVVTQLPIYDAIKHALHI